jgi:acyl carrier protein
MKSEAQGPMSELDHKLERCFQAVFPDLPRAELRAATAHGTPGWDSTSLLMLMSVVEEEFSIVVEIEDLEQWTSFAAIAEYLTART